MPENNPDNGAVQLCLFDISQAENINRASAYINELDVIIVDRKSARIANIIKTSDKPDHEIFVLVASKSLSFKQICLQTLLQSR